MAYHLAVVGSRRRRDRGYVESETERTIRERLAEHGSVCVVSGACEGVDTWAVAVARGLGCEVIEYGLTRELLRGQPRWKWTRAAYKRNAEIAEKCDEMLAFVSFDRTGGTEQAVKSAVDRGRRVTVR